MGSIEFGSPPWTDQVDFHGSAQYGCPRSPETEHFGNHSLMVVEAPAAQCGSVRLDLFKEAGLDEHFGRIPNRRKGDLCSFSDVEKAMAPVR